MDTDAAADGTRTHFVRAYTWVLLCAALLSAAAGVVESFEAELGNCHRRWIGDRHLNVVADEFDVGDVFARFVDPDQPNVAL